MMTWKIMMPIGAFISIMGILIIAINSVILDLILESNMVLSPSSRSYPMWKDLPVPLTASFYLFHISNAEDVYRYELFKKCSCSLFIVYFMKKEAT